MQSKIHTSLKSIYFKSIVISIARECDMYQHYFVEAICHAAAGQMCPTETFLAIDYSIFRNVSVRHIELGGTLM